MHPIKFFLNLQNTIIPRIKQLHEDQKQRTGMKRKKNKLSFYTIYVSYILYKLYISYIIECSI